MEFIYEGLAGLETISPYVYLLVLLGGVVSAVSICYVPILVMFSGFTSGHAREGVGKALGMTTSFTIGMMITSAIIGVTAAFVGNSIMQIFTGYALDVWIPAVIGIVMGLQLLGIIHLRMPRMLQVKTKKPKTTAGWLTLGLPFGLVITPCTIPIFIMIITYVAVNGSLVHGALLLATYAIGKGLVLTLVAVSSATFLKDIARKWGGRVEKVTGIVLILVSLYLIFFQVTMEMPETPQHNGH
jgi:cytochrome c-type biogenesis protein